MMEFDEAVSLMQAAGEVSRLLEQKESVKDGYYWVENIQTGEKKLVEIRASKVSLSFNENQYKQANLPEYGFLDRRTKEVI